MDWTCGHESTGHNDGPCCAVCALEAERDALEQECNDASERLRWGIEEIEKVRSERDAALAEVVKLRKALENCVIEVLLSSTYERARRKVCEVAEAALSATASLAPQKED